METVYLPFVQGTLWWHEAHVARHGVTGAVLVAGLWVLLRILRCAPRSRPALRRELGNYVAPLALIVLGGMLLLLPVWSGLDGMLMRRVAMLPPFCLLTHRQPPAGVDTPASPSRPPNELGLVVGEGVWP